MFKGEQDVASLRNKSRQYESTKLNVSARNRKLEVGESYSGLAGILFWVLSGESERVDRAV